MHATTGLLEISALLVGGAFVAVAVCARFGLPTIAGYLIAGILVGPFGFQLVADGEDLAIFGEIGVILLLFTLGLEFSLAKLIEMRRHIFGVGASQVAITAALTSVLLATLLSMPMTAAVLIGGAVAMSSTALCLKTLSGVGALSTQQGRIAIAVLLFQDLAAVALLVFHDAALGSSIGDGAVRFLIGLIALGAALLLARAALQALARWIASTGDTELAQLLALSIALLTAIMAVALGLSPAIGAFAAGMMISEGDARNVVEKEIRPFRDLLVGIFFISIGTQLQLGGSIDIWLAALGWLVFLVFGKAILVNLILRFFGETKEISWRAGWILAHGGEFGLMLVSVAMASGLVPPDVGTPLLLALGISMLMAAQIVKSAAKEN
ncbi:cation:proton antiporter domain-containing protein [Roseibium aggregatum]|uniref:K(+)/H(+) antiporter n=1 Tax=Roseibium aggregatum TaxID=187304 RepID=A0A0M6YB06_9HYPH|nr:cation:proton antiporter [Roseibium aggregatum]CTQ47262.1 K(+)/H(+) antiporter [Roseibium aggregatum]